MGVLRAEHDLYDVQAVLDLEHELLVDDEYRGKEECNFPRIRGSFRTAISQLNDVLQRVHGMGFYLQDLSLWFASLKSLS